MPRNKGSKLAVGFALCLGLTASAQEPPKDAKKESPPATAVFLDDLSYSASFAFAAAAPAPGSVEEAIQKSLQHHPDVRLAEAKRAVADAELAQAKLLVTQRVTLAHGKVAAAKAQLSLKEVEMERVKKLSATGVVPVEELRRSEAELAAAKANLAAAEADLRAAIGEPLTANDGPVKFGVRWLTMNQTHLDSWSADRPAPDSAARLWELALTRERPAPGTPAEKIRELLDKPVKLDALTKAKLGTAIGALKTAAGTDLMIRFPTEWTRVRDDTLTLPAGEMSFLSAFDLILDEFNGSVEPRERLAVYVREYGLMLTSSQFAPPGALTLGEYARQVRIEKAAEAARKAPEKK